MDKSTYREEEQIKIFADYGKIIFLYIDPIIYNNNYNFKISLK